jgi:hypothetical protein
LLQAALGTRLEKTQTTKTEDSMGKKGKDKNKEEKPKKETKARKETKPEEAKKEEKE